MWKYFSLTALVFVLSSVLLYISTTRLDPLGEQKVLAFFCFFFSLFLSTSSFFALLFFSLSELFSKKRQLGILDFLVSLRRGGLIGMVVVCSSILQILHLAGIFEITLLILFGILVEAGFLATKKT